MKPEQLSQLQIDPERKRRPRGSVTTVFVVIALCVIAAGYFVWPRSGGERRILGSAPASPSTQKESAPAAAVPATGKAETAAMAKALSAPGALTVSGYIINRERIEVSPRFQGVVKWVGVKKGDPVRKDQVVVLLEDSEQKARVAECEARLASARVALERAELQNKRASELLDRSATSQEAGDEARLNVAAAKAAITEIEAQLSLARTYLDWTVIRSPIDGVVLEKLAEPGELVTPQSFGGTRGPSTAVLAVADPQDLQVEIDVSESDLAKISPGQRCRVTPEAYPDRHYDGAVAEISPEANRQKGTLQIKVQILKPDRYLTPELSAKVDFAAGEVKGLKG